MTGRSTSFVKLCTDLAPVLGKHSIVLLYRISKVCMINFFLIRPTRRTRFPNLFCQKLYMFRAISLPIIRSFLLYIRRCCI